MVYPLPSINTAYLFYTNNGNSTSTIFYTRPALPPATLHSSNNFLQTSWYSIMLTMNYKTYDSSAHSTTSTDVSPHGIHHNFFSHYQISQPNSTNFSHNPSQPAFAKHTPGASAQNSTHHMESFSSNKRNPGERVEQSSATSDPSQAHYYEPPPRH